MAVAVAALLLSMSAFAALSFYDFSEERPSGRTTVPENVALGAAALSAEGILDTDLDGIPDSVENFVYGTDPGNWSTSGSGIPDGWLVRYGFDAVDLTIGDQAAATPPVSALPAAYGNAWPAKYTPSLAEIYTFERPADWDEATQGPYDSGLDPSDWDSNDDGIADGWLLHYGLDPLDDNVSDRRLAGAAGLAVAEAFEHDTDPRATDTDGDGLTDREEIDGPADPDGAGGRFPPSNPRAYSTTGSGVCDGYLVAHGLDPSVSENAYGDPAKSGASTVERFAWSHDRFGDDACADGAGLDPSRQSTTDGPIPDGWLMAYGLDPLAEDVALQETESTSAGSAPGVKTEVEGLPSKAHVTLTVLDEYQYGMPPDWAQALLGPWWGGTDPSDHDTDGDGLDDAVEIRGYYVDVSTDVGPSAAFRTINATSDPTLQDTDGDGLVDLDEVVALGTDPSRRDTDVDGIGDAVEVDSAFGLDATRADTVGDYLLDGLRLRMLEERAARYGVDDRYEYAGEPGVERRVKDWACALPGVQAHVELAVADAAPCNDVLTSADLVELFGPTGNLNGRETDDGTPVPNVLDADIDGDGLLNGWELDPRLYRNSPFGEGDLPRPATDPLNPDTDGDRLEDSWEIKHGRAVFSMAPPGYDVDPSRWDSDGDGDSDADEDFDEDDTDWVSLHLGVSGVDVRSTDFPFPNILEQQYGTDPHRFASDRDELGDGWKAFWGIEYLNVVAHDAAELGLHYPGAPGEFQLPADAPAPIPGTPQAGTVISEHTYTRFVLDPFAEVGDGEIVVAEISDVPVQDDEGNVVLTNVYEVEGAAAFTFQDAQEARTNPYVSSTVGDGVPDGWKWFYQQVPAGTPTQADCDASLVHDPVDPDLWDDDLDEDGLTVLQEYELGTNPLCRSTTLTGLPDGLMAQLGGALDPRKAKAFLEQQADRDGDGLFDFEEVLGVRYEHLGQMLTTDPENPDSDGDGLLDGPDLVLDASDPEDAKWIRWFLDVGIAYRERGDEFTFQGEMEHRTHPLNADDSGTGVPAGWLVAHGFNPKLPPGDFTAHYAFGMPTWWDAAVFGPWWGGLLPAADASAAANDPDKDGDGLRDVDGADGYEDPMPGANWENDWRSLPWTNGYPASVVPDAGPPAHGQDPMSPTVEAGTARALAQSYVNPRAEGNDFVSYPRASLDVPTGRTQPCLDFERATGLRDGDDNIITRLVKGETAFLEGRVHHCSTGDGYHGVTVEVRMGNPPQSFGAAFTESDGSFRLPLTIAADHSVDVPAGGPAVVLRGATSGKVNWSSDPSSVAPGSPRFLTLRSYASPATEPFTDDRPALASRSLTESFAVEARSSLTLTPPADVVTGSGASFTVEFRLVDSGGAPLQDDVVFSWGGNEYRASPDPSGGGEVNLPSPHALAGVGTVVAWSDPTDARLEYVSAASSDAPVTLRRPVDASIDEMPASVDAGDVLPVTGRVLFSNTGVAGITVAVNLTSGLEGIAQAQVETGSDGVFSVMLPIPAGQPNGEFLVVATAHETDRSVEVQTSALVTIRSVPRFSEVRATNITQGDAVTVSGRLLEPDGVPVGDALVRIEIAAHETTATTDAFGRFAAEMTPELPSRPVLQSVFFDGDALHAAVTNRTERAVLTPTTLELAHGTLARGGDAAVRVRLVDANEAPVGGAAVWVTWGDEAAMMVLTGETGRAAFERPGAADDPLGPVTVHGAYPGSRDGGRASSSAVAVWKVGTASEIVLPNGSYQAGEPIPSAVLRDAGTKEPIAHAPIEFRVSSNAAVEAITDDEGRFDVLATVNASSAPQAFELEARYAGDSVFAPAETESVVVVRTPVTMAVRVPANVVMGRATFVTADVVGLDGNRVDDGVVAVVLGDRPLASAPVENGSVRLTVTVPEDAEPGPATLGFTFSEAEWYAPGTSDGPTFLLRGVSLSFEIREASPGSQAVVKVRAVSGGQPVAFAPIHLHLEGVEGGLEGTTDADGVATFQIIQPGFATRVAASFPGQEQMTSAHALDRLVPASPTPMLEKATRSLSWVALAAGALLLTLVPIVYRLRRSPLEPVLERVRRILAAGGPDAQQVFLAYRALEEAAIGFGIMNQVATTVRVLQEALTPHVPAYVHGRLDHLMTLFEMARYGEAPIGPSHREEALDALDAIIESLRRETGLSWRRPKEKGALKEVAA